MKKSTDKLVYRTGQPASFVKKKLENIWYIFSGTHPNKKNDHVINNPTNKGKAISRKALKNDLI